MTNPKVTTNLEATTADDPPRACLWCDKALRSGQRGSEPRFCSAAHRVSFWTACRKLGEQAVAHGIVSVADLRSDPVACTLGWSGKAPLPAPDAGATNRASPEALVRTMIEIPELLIRKLIFLYCELRYSERDDIVAVLRALARIGCKPRVIRVSEDDTVISF